MLGFDLIYGGDDAAFTSFRSGSSCLSFIAQPAERTWSWWGLVMGPFNALHFVIDGARLARERPGSAESLTL